MYDFLPPEAPDYDLSIQNNNATVVNCNNYDNQDEQDAGVVTNSCWRRSDGDGTAGNDRTDDNRYDDREDDGNDGDAYHYTKDNNGNCGLLEGNNSLNATKTNDHPSPSTNTEPIYSYSIDDDPFNSPKYPTIYPLVQW